MRTLLLPHLVGAVHQRSTTRPRRSRAVSQQPPRCLPDPCRSLVNSILYDADRSSTEAKGSPRECGRKPKEEHNRQGVGARATRRSQDCLEYDASQECQDSRTQVTRARLQPHLPKHGCHSQDTPRSGATEACNRKPADWHSAPGICCACHVGRHRPHLVAHQEDHQRVPTHTSWPARSACTHRGLHFSSRHWRRSGNFRYHPSIASRCSLS